MTRNSLGYVNKEKVRLSLASRLASLGGRWNIRARKSNNLPYLQCTSRIQAGSSEFWQLNVQLEIVFWPEKREMKSW